MTTLKHQYLAWWVKALAVVLVLSASVKAQEALTAIVVRMSGSGMQRLEARIERYMSEEEVGELGRIVTAGGQQALLAAVQGHKLGSLVLSDGKTLSIGAAQASLTTTGRQIVIVTVRPILSQTALPLLSDYPFQIVELDIDAADRGTGRLIEQAKLSIDARGLLSIASYVGASQMLTEVKRAPE